MTISDEARADVGGSSRRPRPNLLVMVLLLAVVVMSVGLWQWRSPDAFGEQGNTVSINNQVGTTALLGVVTPRQEMDPAALTVHSVEPQVVEGDATVEVIVCHTDAERPGIGAVRGQAEGRHCASHEEPEGARLGSHDDLVLRIHSEKPGRVVVDGVKVTYSHGWRRGSQLTGLTATVEFGTEIVEEHLPGD